MTSPESHGRAECSDHKHSAAFAEDFIIYINSHDGIRTHCPCPVQKIDWSSADYDFALDDSYIYMISPQTQKLVQVVFEGGSLAIADGQFANSNLAQKVSLHKRWVVGLITNSKYGIMKTTV